MRAFEHVQPCSEVPEDSVTFKVSESGLIAWKVREGDGTGTVNQTRDQVIAMRDALTTWIDDGPWDGVSAPPDHVNIIRDNENDRWGRTAWGQWLLIDGEQDPQDWDSQIMRSARPYRYDPRERTGTPR